MSTVIVVTEKILSDDTENNRLLPSLPRTVIMAEYF